MVCPLDGTKFEAWQDFSGTSFGARLDFKKEGPIAQPWALAQCPKCRFPLFKPEKDLTADEITRLKAIVSDERFLNESKGATAYYALGLIKEALQAEPLEIGWAYLCASWEVEGDPAKYLAAANKVIFWHDEAAKRLGDTNEKNADYFTACYLPIEISRRLGNFAEADRRITNFPPATKAAPEWLADTLRFQRSLVANHDNSAHTFAEIEPKKEVALAAAPRGLKPPAANASVEEKVRYNLRRLSAAADQYMLENGVSEAPYAKLVGPEPEKTIKQLDPVAGEDYSKLKIAIDNEEVVVILPNGSRVTYKR